MTDNTPLNADDSFKYDELDSQIIEAITCSGAYWDYKQQKAIRGLVKKHELQAREQAIEDVKYAGYGYDDGTGFVLKISYAELAALKEHKAGL